MIAAVCQLNGIELVLLTQPCSLESHEFVNLETFLAYNSEIVRMANERDIKFIDMFSMMGHDKELFTDDVHYTPEGVDRFARLLSSEMEVIIRELGSD